jgi:hypothetical protein
LGRKSLASRVIPGNEDPSSAKSIDTVSSNTNNERKEGSVDHDFLKGDDRERPFAPPPEQPILRWLGALLALLALAYSGYRLIEWLSYRPPTAVITPATVAPSRATEQVSKQAPSNATSEAGTRMVTKCLSNGKTTYSDSNCAAGEKTSQVATKENHNLMDAVRVPATSPTAELSVQSTVITQGKTNPDYAAMKAECATLDERVKYLDAMARQPQSMQMHDWIRNERKIARDRQARIPCQ